MKRLLAVSLAVNLSLMPLTANAQSSGYHTLFYPDQNLPDRGGRIGIEVEQQQYFQNGVVFLKVSRVLAGSPLNGVVVPGDFIYGINGFNLRGYQDLISVIHSGSSGYSERIYFLDSRDNFRAKYANVTALSDTELKQASVSDKPYCEEHPWVCVAGVVGVVIIGAAIASSLSKSDNNASRSGGSVNDGQSWQERQRDAEEQRRAEEQARQNKSSSSSSAGTSDTSIGCAWGDRAYGTCH